MLFDDEVIHQVIDAAEEAVREIQDMETHHDNELHSNEIMVELQHELMLVDDDEVLYQHDVIEVDVHDEMVERDIPVTYHELHNIIVGDDDEIDVLQFEVDDVVDEIDDEKARIDVMLLVVEADDDEVHHERDMYDENEHAVL